MDYSGFITTICAVLEYQVVDAASATPTGTVFDQIIPSMLDYTENRLQRDLDFIATTYTDPNGLTTANQRLAALPTTGGTYIVSQQIRLIIGGVRQQPLEWVSRAFLDFAWPSDVSITDANGVPVNPVQVAMNDQDSVLFGPAPPAGLAFEAVGTIRFEQLSSTNPQNFLTTTVPDLYVAAALVWAFGYQKDFGAQADNPQTAQSWEAQYQALLKGAQVEEIRKQFSDMSPSPSSPVGLTAQTGG